MKINWDCCLAHDLLIWLRENCNQKVKEDDDNHELVKHPEHPNKSNHKPSLTLDIRISILHVFRPHWIDRWSYISNWVPVCLKDIDVEWTDIRVIPIIKVNSSKEIHDAEVYDPQYEESWKFLHIIDAYLQESHQLPKLLVYPEIEHDFEESKAHNCDGQQNVADSEKAFLL